MQKTCICKDSALHLIPVHVQIFPQFHFQTVHQCQYWCFATNCSLLQFTIANWENAMTKFQHLDHTSFVSYTLPMELMGGNKVQCCRLFEHGSLKVSEWWCVHCLYMCTLEYWRPSLLYLHRYIDTIPSDILMYWHLNTQSILCIPQMNIKIHSGTVGCTMHTAKSTRRDEYAHTDLQPSHCKLSICIQIMFC